MNLFSTVPSKGHDAQVYENLPLMRDAVSEYALHGLQKGEAVLLIGSKTNLKTILSSLAETGVQAQKQGQLVTLDAEETLSKFIRNDAPNADLFLKTLSATVDVLISKWPKVRAWGEMVNLLWQRKKVDAAIQLEEFWNNLGHNRSFYLLCTYLVDFFEKSDERPKMMRGIHHTHSQLLPNKDYQSLTNSIHAALEKVLGCSQAQMIYTLVKNHSHTSSSLGVAEIISWMQNHMPLNAVRVLETAKSIYTEQSCTPAEH